MNSNFYGTKIHSTCALPSLTRPPHTYYQKTHTLKRKHLSLLIQTLTLHRLHKQSTGVGTEVPEGIHSPSGHSNSHQSEINTL